MLPQLLNISPLWRSYHQRTGTSGPAARIASRGGLDLAMWDNHSSYGGMGTEKRVPKMRRKNHENLSWLRGMEPERRGRGLRNC